MRKPLPYRRRHAALIAALMLALVLVQFLGLVHRVAHADIAAPSPGAPSTSAATPASGTWLQELFAGHDGGDASCEVYDQLTHADPLASICSLAAMPIPESATAIATAAGHIAAQASGYFARGPPQLS